MSFEKIILWYEENVNYRLTKSFLEFLVKIGIVKEDIDLDFLNLYLLEKNGDDFIVENGKYKLKVNRLPILMNFKCETLDNKKPLIKPIVTFIKSKDDKKTVKKFKIENTGEKRMKLIKI